MTKLRYDTFEYSGDLEWAQWRRSVLCYYCRSDGLVEHEAIPEAIGLAVQYFTYYGDADHVVAVRPVCEDCAKDKTVHIFPDKEDN